MIADKTQKKLHHIISEKEKEREREREGEREMIICAIFHLG